MSDPATPDRAELERLLSRCGQQHVLAYWEELSPAEQSSLAGQIATAVEAIEGELAGLLSQLQRTAADAASLAPAALPADAAAPPATDLTADGLTADERQSAHARGMAALAAGEVAVLVLAGGEGSRLGFAGPKSLLPIGPISGATLIQLVCEKVATAARRAGGLIPLCVMTSPTTHAGIVEHFEANRHFGLNSDELFLFEQGTLPAVDASHGRLLLADRGNLQLSPDGHGGAIRALARHGILTSLRQSGVKTLFCVQVDNPLVPVCDPVSIGLHLEHASQATIKTRIKQSADEHVGTMVDIGGRTRVVEYSDLPPEVAARRSPAGELVFHRASVAVYLFELELFEQAAEADPLPLHVAHKKVKHLTADGALIEPSEPNALKFERFIFDVLPRAERTLVLGIDPDQEYAPIKDRKRSPEAAQAQLQAEFLRWLQLAGAEVAPGVTVEISPRYAASADELAARLPAGTRIERPTYLQQ